MKTIEERAIDYADRHKATEINYFGVGKVYGYERIYNAEITAYERGATKQREIDIEKASEWFKRNAEEYFEISIKYGDTSIELSRKFYDDFRKVMEE